MAVTPARTHTSLPHPEGPVATINAALLTLDALEAMIKEPLPTRLHRMTLSTRQQETFSAERRQQAKVGHLTHEQNVKSLQCHLVHGLALLAAHSRMKTPLATYFRTGTRVAVLATATLQISTFSSSACMAKHHCTLPICTVFQQAQQHSNYHLQTLVEAPPTAMCPGCCHTF